MFKFLFFGGLLVALIFGYTDKSSSNSAPNPPSSSSFTVPWSGVDIGGKAFWADQAKAGTALWKHSLHWCQHEFNDANQPTVVDGVCTIVLSVNSDIKGNTNL